MPREDFYTPTEIDALRMENELLSFETRFLRAQLAASTEELERFVTELRDKVEDCDRRLDESERSAAQSRAKAERAEQDIALLLRRLASSPFGWFFSTKQNFRILEQRYLGSDD